MRTGSARTRSAAAAVTLGVLLATLAPGEARAARGWAWPVEGAVITHYSNDERNPYAGGVHRGIDIDAAVGTTVRAARAGEVTYAGALGYSGLVVAVRTVDGYVTSYLHLSATTVRRGEQVAGRTELGRVGTSGRRSARAPHLHFGVRLAGDGRRYVDPLSMLPGAAGINGAGAPAPVPVALSPAPERAPARALARARLARRPASAPGVRPAPAPDPGRPLALAGLGLLVLALFGRGALRAARNANGALSGAIYAALARALRPARACFPRWRKAT